ncbi:MAG: hypothetical protein AUJ12_09125 [Alphaproteobacteria bacterium CG1_02_46_17]|nr:MAG: hypothetical protein AUJ12_09125 [Alphaproteobacteria bacterium CG1_02_46_17]
MAPSRQVTSPDGKNTVEVKSIDQIVREVAAVEPVLKFPARIGLARIDGGSLTNLTQDDANAWKEMQNKLGSSFGEFIAINPLVAKMVQGYVNDRGYGYRVQSVIDNIRLAAARQHLDAVLIYEVMSKENRSTNILAVANMSIIGGYILPSKSAEVEGLGNAILIDVIQGYPYGTMHTIVDKQSRLSSSWGWGSDSADRERFANAIKSQAAQQLADQSYDMFIKLQAALAEKSKEKQ